MFELFLGLGESLLVIFFQIWLLGLVLCLLLCRRRLWTFTDAFFLGLLWNALVGLFIAPFMSDTFTISLFVKASCVLLLLGFSLHFLFNKKYYKGKFTGALGRSLSKNHILLAMGVALIVMGFVVTHTLGFDDIAHLKYLDEAKMIEPYPVFRLLVGEWEAARYPLFGLLIGELGQNIAGSALFLYYTLGVTIFIAFILKVYEFLLAGNLQKFVALATVLLVASVLMIGGADNYFNYGLYPLQQSKLLFIVGLLYILIGWGIQRNQFYFFIGSGLLIFAVLYHLNLLLLYAVIAPLIILYIFIRRTSRKQWLVLSLSFILLPLLAVPAALSPENGFLRYEEPPVEVSTGGAPAVKKEKPSQFALFMIKAKKMLSWIKNGRYKTKYFQRVFSLDIILIPLILIFALQIGLLINFGFLAVVIALMIFVQQVITVIPKQLMTSMFHSGPFWVLADISRSGIGFSQSSGRTLTDPYTEIILKILGVKNIQHLTDQQNLLSFSPQFSTVGRQYVASQLELSEEDRFLFNGRYSGIKAVDDWQGVDDGNLDHLGKNLDDFYEKGNLQRLKSIARRGLDYAKIQINMPMLTRTSMSESQSDALQDLLDILPKESVSIYRNAALVNISNLAIGDKVRLKFEGKGDPDYLGFLSRNKELKALNITGKKRVFTFDVVDNIPHIVLFFEMDLGHMGGLGTMESVSISINE